LTLEIYTVVRLHYLVESPTLLGIGTVGVPGNTKISTFTPIVAVVRFVGKGGVFIYDTVVDILGTLYSGVGFSIGYSTVGDSLGETWP